MALEYVVDFTSVLPQKHTPRLNEVQTWLNYSIKDIGRGNIIVQTKPGVFVLKVHDDAKGQSIENKKLNYYLAGDIEAKKPFPITIVKREYRRKYVNPKYVTVWDVNREDLSDVATIVCKGVSTSP